jgi:chromosome segregation ATPase
MEHTAQGFQRVEGQVGALASRLDDLTGQVESLVGLVREQGLRLTSLAEQQAEQQVQIRQILHRLEQHDARFEEHSRRLDEHSRRLDEHGVYIRRMLDLLERRGGDGGPANR